MFSAQRKFQCCINTNWIVTECVLLCELCYVCLCVTSLQDSMTSIPFTLLDHNRHHITRETTLLSLDRGWNEGIRKKTLKCLWTHMHTSGAILQKMKQKTPGNILQQSQEDYITFPRKWWVIVIILYHLHQETGCMGLKMSSCLHRY